jgi:hypothetical protein
MPRKLLVKDDAHIFYSVDKCNMIWSEDETIDEESVDGLTKCDGNFVHLTLIYPSWW